MLGSCAAATFSITVAGTTTAPTGVSATPGNTRTTVSFTAPTTSGAILGYTAIASPGGATANGVGSPLTVGGLTNGVGYTFTVKATYTNGTVKESDASTLVTPTADKTAPDSPTIGTVTAGNAQATVTFGAPANTGGSAITGYTVTSSPGGISVSGTASPLTVTGLINGTAYIFTVTAKNAIGTGLPSLASSSVTPTTGVTMPGAPTIGTASAGNTQATVTFAAPASTGGSAITGYTVTSSPGALAVTGAASPLIVTGLTNGTAYTFAVTARNVIGTSLPSAATNSVTPVAVTVPGAPTIGTASAGNAQATVSFSAPAITGGSAITGYTVTSNPAGGVDANAATTGLTHSITGLTNGTAYIFTVTATNAVGTGAASAASNSATPAGVPCLLYTSPSPRDRTRARMPSSA